MPQQDLINQIVNRVNDFNRRVRDLEEKLRNLNARVNTLDESLLNKTKSLGNEIQELEDEIEDVRDRMANLEVDIKEINREKRKFVSEQELGEIENYMKLMNPMNSAFITKKEAEDLFEKKQVSKQEVERMIDRKIKRQQNQADNNVSQTDERK